MSDLATLAELSMHGLMVVAIAVMWRRIEKLTDIAIKRAQRDSDDIEALRAQVVKQNGETRL